LLGWQTFYGMSSGDPLAARAAAEEGLPLAVRTGNHVASRQCRTWLGSALYMQGDLAGALALAREVETEADAARDPIWKFFTLQHQARTLAYLGQLDTARAAAEGCIAIAGDFGVVYEALGSAALSVIAM